MIGGERSAGHGEIRSAWLFRGRRLALGDRPVRTVRPRSFRTVSHGSARAVSGTRRQVEPGRFVEGAPNLARLLDRLQLGSLLIVQRGSRLGLELLFNLAGLLPQSMNRLHCAHQGVPVRFFLLQLVQ